MRQDPDENYRFLLPLSGDIVLRQDDQEARLTPGTGALVSFGAPFECLQSASTDAFIFTIPAHEVDGPMNRKSPLAAGLDLRRGLGRVVGSMLNGLYEERDDLTDPQFNSVSDRVVELLCMLAVGDDRPDVPGHLAQVEAMVRRYVRGHAADPELTGAEMAQALGWSLRQVQLALQRVGTTPPGTDQGGAATAGAGPAAVHGVRAHDDQRSGVRVGLLLRERAQHRVPAALRAESPRDAVRKPLTRRPGSARQSMYTPLMTRSPSSARAVF